MNILVTGGAGFIGRAFVKKALREGKGRVIVLDALTYAGDVDNLREFAPWAALRIGDICDGQLVRSILQEERIDAIVNIAAESHVDRSIENSMPFIKTNVVGTATLLEAARKINPKIRFVQVSTDEVYGEVEDGQAFHEGMRLRPRNPYSATKAAGDVLVLSYCNTYGTNAVITRCSNNYGPYQQAEKFIPKSIVALLRGQKIKLHGDGQQMRDWIHVDDHVSGIYKAMLSDKRGQAFNFGSGESLANVTVARAILECLGYGGEEAWIEYVADRPGNDKAYRMNSYYAQVHLGWTLDVQFKEGLKATIDWYREHREWWDKVGLSAFYGAR
ncbi:MAG: dTDP-glucose 4,6-dehydratase [Planctomycetota bacterium]|nr:dTDP-glucose 4,6-dehydratase [Planctomycetota bacterium]